MAKRNDLGAMTVDALLELKDKIQSILGDRSQELTSQLRRLQAIDIKPIRANHVRMARGTPRGTKVAPKYRGPNGETWAGRGNRPRWLMAELKRGKKLENFLIGTRMKRQSAGARA